MSLLPSVVVDPVDTEAAADFAGGQIPRLDRPVDRVGDSRSSAAIPFGFNVGVKADDG
jgi:hypothetical protein